MFDFFSFWKSCASFLELISFPIAVISLLGILFYYLYFFVKLNFKKDKGTSFSEPISVIICAKNELNNLKKNLPILLVQNYFNYEVIVVNDQSSDSSILFLNELAANNKDLVIVDIDDFVKHTPGKKFALTLGIKTAKHEHILLTDADCIPTSKDWIKQRNLKITLSDELRNGYHEIIGKGKDWIPRHYSLMIIEFFQSGITKCLIGTRGLLGEGWDASRINVLIDLTTVTTSMSINQLRGRSIRLDKLWPEKVANNWDIICNEMIPEVAKQGIAVFNDGVVQQLQALAIFIRSIADGGRTITCNDVACVA